MMVADAIVRCLAWTIPLSRVINLRDDLMSNDESIVQTNFIELTAEIVLPMLRTILFKLLAFPN